MDNTIIFLHIPKTAGSTLNRVIEWQYGIKAVYYRLLSKNNYIFTSTGVKFSRNGMSKSYLNELESLSNKEKEHIKIIRGHVCFGIHNYLNKKHTYITILRDPVDRVISAYYYIRRAPEHHLYPIIHDNNLTLKDFITEKITTEVDNAQTRLLYGIESHDIAFGETFPEMVEVAKNNLAKYFEVVGIMEEFDKTLVLIQNRLKWKPPFYVRENVTKNRIKKENLNEEIINLIKEHNELDIELYNFAKNMFLKKINEIANFNYKYKRFINLNNLFQKIYPFFSPIIKSGEKLGAKIYFSK